MTNTEPKASNKTKGMGHQGHILLAHGSRDAGWRQGLEAVAARLNAPHQPACCAYLELCPPTLHAAAGALIERGCTQLVITPMFLGLGQHARHDIPQLAQQLQRDFPEIAVQLRAALCDAPGFVDALTRMIDLNSESNAPQSNI